jgi:hypothetical protein
MNKTVLTAPCGLDCFNCPTYKDNIVKVPLPARFLFSIFVKVPLKELPCNGCRDEKGYCKFAKGRHCLTWDCAQEKGVTYCYECVDFPCQKLMPTKKGARYPHNMKVYNLGRMKLVGVEKWTEEAAEIRERYFKGKFLVGLGPVLENDKI